ncbi:MAG: BREX system serine/threonine kinase PglW [Candidatus Schekmanbacteria bacterium]|nr:BREX system serine/threonine kinase PglW [Candidatus Schekmanbacteria bacterium]
MAMKSERWKTITESEYPWERSALDFVREGLPDHEPCRAWANFSFLTDTGKIYEVDLLVLTPKGFFLVEIKSRPGTLEGDSATWTWTTDGELHTRDNPLLLADHKAKCLASLLRKQKSTEKAGVPYLQAVVFLSAEELVCKLSPSARQHVYRRDRLASEGRGARAGILDLLASYRPGDAPSGRRIDRPVARALSQAMASAGIRQRQSYRSIGDHELESILIEGPGYQDWLSHHRSFPDIKRRVRLYPVVGAASAEERKQREDAARREYKILQGIKHSGILRAEGFSVHERGLALIFEHDAAAQRLDYFLRNRRETLGLDARLAILRQIAETIEHAHGRRLYHRALSPQSILVRDGRAGVTASGDAGSGALAVQIHNWQTGERTPGSGTQAGIGGAGWAVSGTSHPEVFIDRAALVYVAPEVLSQRDPDPELADVFSLGALAYFILSGLAPAANPVELGERLRAHAGLRLASVMDGVAASLDELVAFSTDPVVANRYPSVRQFCEQLDVVLDELTTPVDDAVDPLDAAADDRLQGGFVVRKRLGKGATATALLVERDGKVAVLKVANTVAQNQRLADEGEVLGKIKHQHIVALYETLTMGERVALLMEPAGEETLAERLRSGGRLHLELLERFGADLLRAVDYLEAEGLSHRDIKPDNIGIRKASGSGKLRLVLFDFSLARMPGDNIFAGTPPYLDPFLSRRTSPRWDDHAERFAAAMTLYEMATGTLPVWGDGQSDPAQLEDEVTIDSELFDTSLREGLGEFFERALARDPAARFENAEVMSKEWQEVFRRGAGGGALDRHADPEALAAALAEIGPRSPVALLPCSSRAQALLERLGILTASELAQIPPNRFFGVRSVGMSTSREVARLAAALAGKLAGFAAAEIGLDGTEASIDMLLDDLRSSRARNRDLDILDAVLGISPPATGWPGRDEVADTLDVPRVEVAKVLRHATARLARNPAFTRLRDDIAEQLQAEGGAMTAQELARKLLVRRGSARQGEERQLAALAVGRAAVETELSLQNPRFIMHRTACAQLVASDGSRADYALRLGAAADELAGADPLPPPARVEETLRAVPAPEHVVLSKSRLIELAAAASMNAAVSGRLELYPVGLAADRALKLAYGALMGTAQLTVDAVRDRVASRYRKAAPLPDRPALDGLLAAAGLELRWQPDAADGKGAYVSTHTTLLSLSAGSSSLTRETLAGTPQREWTPEAAALQEFRERLQGSLDTGGFLILTARPRELGLAEEALLGSFAVKRLSFEALFLEAIEATAKMRGVDMQIVFRADAADRGSRDWTNLERLVGLAVPIVEERIVSSPDPLLMVHVGLVGRYGQFSLLDRIRERTHAGGGLRAAWLLVATPDQHSLPLMDGKAIPIVGPGDFARIPEAWLATYRGGAAGG